MDVLIVYCFVKCVQHQKSMFEIFWHLWHTLTDHMHTWIHTDDSINSTLIWTLLSILYYTNVALRNIHFVYIRITNAEHVCVVLKAKDLIFSLAFIIECKKIKRMELLLKNRIFFKFYGWLTLYSCRCHFDNSNQR